MIRGSVMLDATVHVLVGNASIVTEETENLQDADNACGAGAGNALDGNARFLILFASMHSFAGALILKHQMRRAQLHKNQNCLKRLKRKGAGGRGL